jgi:hypothetical protein
MTTMRTLFLSLTLVTLAATGCGGDDNTGLDPNQKFSALSATERMNACSWAVAELGGAGKTTQCTSEDSFTVPSTAECVGSTTGCMYTVGQFEQCMKAIAAKPCGSAETAACAPVAACGD